MIKYLFLLFNMSFLFLMKSFVGDGVKVSTRLPSRAAAGSEFVVELTINRNDVEGFAKLQHDLPKGFTAEEIESQGASFSFNGQSVKFIWTSLPAETAFKVSYKVKVNEALLGDQVVSGKFSYIVENIKETTDVGESTITIVPVGTEVAVEENTPNKTTDTDAAKAVDKDQVQVETASESTSSTSLSCTRSITKTSMPNEFLVDIKVTKGSLAGFAKLQENIPVGYTATGVNTSNASFTFADQKVKFVWLAIPDDGSFSVSYLIKSEDEISENPNVDGLLSYMENDETKKYFIAPTLVSNNNMAETATEKNNKPSPEIPLNEDKKTEEPAKEDTRPSSNSIPTPETNITYKVQIAALHKMVNVSYFKTQNKITGVINTEMHEGWTKYTTGSFKDYRPARDYRENIRTKKIEGPFVTAYHAGKRITVQEALMITSQKWYK